MVNVANVRRLDGQVGISDEEREALVSFLQEGVKKARLAVRRGYRSGGSFRRLSRRPRSHRPNPYTRRPRGTVLERRIRAGTGMSAAEFFER
jgi:hypothetical protein